MQCVAESAPVVGSASSQPKSRKDLCLCVALLFALNLPLLTGFASDRFLFLPSAVAEGEWWRLLTAPFVHNSVYHLLIDGVAFAFLYTGLQKTAIQRMTLFGASALGGLMLPLWTTPIIWDIGLCGMSGVAHGLMAVWAIELCNFKDKRMRFAGVLSLAFVLSKCIAEMISGHLIFDLVHFGYVGIPIVACHAGGVLGALLVLPVLSYFSRRKPGQSDGEGTPVAQG